MEKEIKQIQEDIARIEKNFKVVVEHINGTWTESMIQRALIFSGIDFLIAFALHMIPSQFHEKIFNKLIEGQNSYLSVWEVKMNKEEKKNLEIYQKEFKKRMMVQTEFNEILKHKKDARKAEENGEPGD